MVLAPQVGLEPTTLRLKLTDSTEVEEGQVPLSAPAGWRPGLNPKFALRGVSRTRGNNTGTSKDRNRPKPSGFILRYPPFTLFHTNEIR
jgi:hypothetical protein